MIGGRQGLAATLLVLVGIVVVDLHGMGRDRCGSCHDGGGLKKSLNPPGHGPRPGHSHVEF